MVKKLISWKNSINRLNEEHKTAEKKKQALDNLLNNGRISESTHTLFNREIDELLTEVEKQRKDLLDKMTSKMMKLDDQIRVLEMLLADFEIRHVSDEIDEETYRRETDLLCTGLDTARQELEAVREAADQISSNNEREQQDLEASPTENTASPDARLMEDSAEDVEKEQAESQEEIAVETIQQSDTESQTECENCKEGKQEQ